MTQCILFAVFLTVCIIGTWSAQAPVKSLNNGNRIPVIALGTAGSEEDIARIRQAVYWAIEAGYRHIDTAELYNNEKEVGQGIADAIRDGLVVREELFITTKLWNNNYGRHKVIPALRGSLERLGLDYVDLYLIHTPIATGDDGSLKNVDYLETWRGMEHAWKQGLAKSIGLSNFNSEQIGRILTYCDVKPVVNEIEVNPTLTQEALVSYCRSVGLEVMAYSPFGFMVFRNKTEAPPPTIHDPALTRMAEKYGKSTSQIVLRYLIDRGTIPIPKSTNKERIKQNIDIFDFHLTDDEIATINEFNRNIRVIDLESLKDSPYYPFNSP